MEKKNPLALPAISRDPHFFDISLYRARMSKYLDPSCEDNRVFFAALEFAEKLHLGQRRKSGAPYISHPCAVAEILARELQFKDPHLLASALLHDVVEDIPSVTVEDIDREFGLVVAELVDGCTKMTRSHLDRATLKDLTHSKIFLSASRRLGVLVIKLADRLHNLRTLHYLPQTKRQRIAHETIEVYAPIAARFSIFSLKRELYHLALSFLYPRKSRKILQYLRELRGSPELLHIENTLHHLFLESSSPAPTIRMRTKGLGSYYSPLKKTLDLSNAENHVDFSIVLPTEDVLECYTALGRVTTAFSTIPRTVRDFIANPKNNGYRSLHVRIHVGGQNFLIKIRTAEIDRWSARGVLQEWNAQRELSDDYWHEISELLRSIGEYGGAGPRRKALIRLSETEEIFVYSPQGDIYYLPRDSIVLDFAYRIHSELGDHCRGALINGEWVSPTRRLKDGDVVKIVTSSDLVDADLHLESVCKTPKARTAINRHLQQKRRRFAENAGRQILRQELDRRGISLGSLEEDYVTLISEFLNLKGPSELYARIGQDLLSPHLVLYYLVSRPAEDEGSKGSAVDGGATFETNILKVDELDTAVHKFARCCNPYPGQSEVMATLSERGITFHHRSCSDLVQRHGLQPQQLVEVRWDEQKAWPHPLIFHLNVLQETPISVLQAWNNPPSSLDLRLLEGWVDRHRQPCLRMKVRLRDFSEARSLFRILPKNRVTIEDYERGEPTGDIQISNPPMV